MCKKPGDSSGMHIDWEHGGCEEGVRNIFYEAVGGMFWLGSTNKEDDCIQREETIMI